MPQERYEALLNDLTATLSDILVLRGLGSRAALDKLQVDLSQTSGQDFTSTYIADDTPYAGLGFLTRRPPLEKNSLSSERYEVEGETYQPLAGGIRISHPGQTDVWIWNAALPEAEADYEKRRNESRLLSQALRPHLAKGDALLLSLHCREDPESPMIRMLTEIGLRQIYAEDHTGDRWTHRDPQGRVYLLDQLLFASPALLDLLDEQPRIHSTPALRQAGEFRHQRLQLQ